MGGMVTLGYSPFSAPHTGSPIYPFNEIFDISSNLYLRKDLEGIDAVLLWGGADISPSLYNTVPIHNSGPVNPSDRDLFEWEILRQATAAKIPIIGVCRGAQMICAFAGGVLVQDCVGHQVNHDIITSDGEIFKVTSSHHQMMYPYEVEHELLAYSLPQRSSFYHGLGFDRSQKMLNREQKEAEVVYFPSINAMAVQCHPEWHTGNDTFNEWLLSKVIEKQFCGLTTR
jgi:gamma-glutamyl-gamma-aminobutyrate hydrolase PuuD